MCRGEGVSDNAWESATIKKLTALGGDVPLGVLAELLQLTLPERTTLRNFDARLLVRSRVCRRCELLL